MQLLKERSKKLLKEISEIARRWLPTVKVGAKLAGEIAGGTIEIKPPVTEKETPSEQIKSLDKELRDLVKNVLGEQKRLVLFIDDLDRLIPQKAVELLESLKLFLDIKGCVFVIACDNQVVALGVKKKFELDETTFKNRNFFDKIIQIPFRMPIYRYYHAHALEFCSKMLEKVSIEYDSHDSNKKIDDITLYVNLINYSVGFNPRVVKRFFNELLLSRQLLQQEEENSLLEDSEENNRSPAGSFPPLRNNEIALIIFAFICLRDAFEPAHDWILQNVVENSTLKELLDTIQSLDQEPFKKWWSNKLGESIINKLIANNFQSFMKEFSKLLKQEDGTTVPLERLRIVMFSSTRVLISEESEKKQLIPAGVTNHDVERYLNLKLVSEVRLEIAKKHLSNFKELKPLISSDHFKYHQPDKGFNELYVNMYLNITPSNKKLRFQLKHELLFEEKKQYIRHFFRWWKDQGERDSGIHRWFIENIQTQLYFFKEFFKKDSITLQIEEVSGYKQYRIPLYTNKIFEPPETITREAFDKEFRETTHKILDELLPHLVKLKKQGKL